MEDKTSPNQVFRKLLPLLPDQMPDLSTWTWQTYCIVFSPNPLRGTLLSLEQSRWSIVYQPPLKTPEVRPREVSICPESHSKEVVALP